jgi:hypothetical protein
MVYQKFVERVWEASFGEVLTCEREPDICSDRYAVAVIINGKAIPHVEIVTNRFRHC